MKAVMLLILGGAGTYIISVLLRHNAGHISDSTATFAIIVWYCILIFAMFVLTSGKRRR